MPMLVFHVAAVLVGKPSLPSSPPNSPLLHEGKNEVMFMTKIAGFLKLFDTDLFVKLTKDLCQQLHAFSRCLSLSLSLSNHL